MNPVYSKYALYVACAINYNSDEQYSEAIDFARARSLFVDTLTRGIFAHDNGSLLYDKDDWMLFIVKPGVNMKLLNSMFDIIPSYSVGIARQPYSACVTAMLSRALGQNRIIEYNNLMAKSIHDFLEVNPAFIVQNSLGIEDMLRSAAAMSDRLMAEPIRQFDLSLSVA